MKRTEEKFNSSKPFFYGHGRKFSLMAPSSVSCSRIGESAEIFLRISICLDRPSSHMSSLDNFDHAVIVICTWKTLTRDRTSSCLRRPLSNLLFPPPHPSSAIGDRWLLLLHYSAHLPPSTPLSKKLRGVIGKLCPHPRPTPHPTRTTGGRWVLLSRHASHLPPSPILALNIEHQKSSTMPPSPPALPNRHLPLSFRAAPHSVTAGHPPPPYHGCRPQNPLQGCHNFFRISQRLTCPSHARLH